MLINTTKVSKKFNILVFPGGTEIGLEIHKSLNHCKNIALYSVSSNCSSHASYVYERHFIIPSIDKSDWIEKLNQIVLDLSIDYIFPAYDDIIVALAQMANRIKAKIISSPLQTCLITRSKTDTYMYFAGLLPIPEIYNDIEIIDQYPVFVKPDKGQGSQDTHLVEGRDQLLQLQQENKDKIVLEYLPGEEYTVDCFSDRERGLLFCSARERVRTKCGISMSSRVAANQEVFLDYASIISGRLTFHGAWFFQIKKDRNGIYKLLEIAPRIAGTMALHRVQGVNFPLLSFYEQERIHLFILTNNANVEIDRALVNRYRHDIQYRTAYIDLDDTLIFNASVNLMVIKFVYQCINKGIRLVLLTKHAADMDATLKQYRLCNIFDEIVHLDQTNDKGDCIVEQDAILIDNSFSERRSVVEKRGIRTFDCSMLEILLDDRS